MIEIQTFPFNPIQVNTYILWDLETKDCILVDPGNWNTGEDEILTSLKRVKCCQNNSYSCTF